MTIYDWPKIQSSPFVEVSLVMNSLPALSYARPAGLKQPELKEGPLPAHLVTSGFQKISFAAVVLVMGSTGA